MVTSARAWSRPIRRAVFVITAPRSMGRVRTSFRPTHTRRLGDTTRTTIIRANFRPTKEVWLRW